MNKQIIEQDYDDNGRLIHEIITHDGIVVRESRFSYPDTAQFQTPNGVTLNGVSTLKVIK